MLSYSAFNKRCLDYYLEHNHSGVYGSFLIPPSVLVDWLKLEYDNPRISFKEISEDWICLSKIDPIHEIPRSFGIIAIQCYGAFLRQNSERTTDRQLNSAIQNLIGFSTNQLQSKFGSGKINNQDRIWKSGRDYIKLRGIEILIPEHNKGSGRNVQYPKSQVFFNLEEFKELNWLLKKAEEAFVSDHDEFQLIFLAEYGSRPAKFSRIKELLRNTTNYSNNRGIFIRQLYNYWLSSDWQNAYLNQLLSKDYNKRLDEPNNEANFEIYFDSEKNELKFFSLEEVQYVLSTETNLESIIEKNVLFFKNEEATPYDYAHSLSIFLNVPYLIIASKSSEIANLLESKFGVKWNTSDDPFVYCHLLEGISDIRFANFITEKVSRVAYNPAEIIAPKLDFRSNRYLFGLELRVKFDHKYLEPKDVEVYAMIGSRKSRIIVPENRNDTELVFSNLNCGDYKVVMWRFNDVKFSISDVSASNLIPYTTTSFHLKSYSIESDLDGITGIRYPLTTVSSAISISHVTNILVNQQHKTSSNYILKALNLAQHGKN